MSIYTFLPDEEPADVPSPQAKAAVARKQRRAYLFSVMEKVKGFVFPVAPHQSPLPEVERGLTVTATFYQPGKWGRCSMCHGIGEHTADCPSVGVTPR